MKRGELSGLGENDGKKWPDVILDESALLDGIASTLEDLSGVAHPDPENGQTEVPVQAATLWALAKMTRSTLKAIDAKVLELERRLAP